MAQTDGIGQVELGKTREPEEMAKNAYDKTSRATEAKQNKYDATADWTERVS